MTTVMKPRPPRISWLTWLVALVLAPLAAATPRPVAAQTADPVAVVAAYVVAANAGDVAAAQALVTPDAVLRFEVGSVDSPDGTRVTGPQGVAARLQAAGAGNVHDELVAPLASGDRVTWTNLHTDDAARRLGLAPLAQRGEATVRQGQVAALTLSFTPEAAARLQTAQSLEVSQAFDAALAAGDVDAALGALTPDARLTTPNAVLTGTEAIRAYLRELIAGDYRVSVVESRAVAPDRVVTQGTVALDQFRRVGLASVEATAEVVALGSRITAITVALTPASAARVQAAQAAATSPAPAAPQAAAQPRPPGLPRTGGAPMRAATPETCRADPPPMSPEEVSSAEALRP
jgi:ketosteroid isomerase-like protein